MPQKTAARLRALLEELTKTQSESGSLAQQARQDIAGVIASGELRPVGTSGSSRRKKKAAATPARKKQGKKKR